jgi:hypothetical protein
VGQMKYGFKTYFGNAEGKRSLGETKLRWKENIKFYLNVI